MISLDSDRLPKGLPVLTEEQRRIREDFHQHCLEVLGEAVWPG